MVLFVENWFCLGKNDCIPAKWLYSGKVVVTGKNGCILAKWLYSGKVVVFGQIECIRAKEIVFG